MRYGHAQSGFSLIEVAIVFVIASVILATAMLFTRTTDDAYDTASASADVSFGIRRALEAVSFDVRRSDVDHVTIDNSDVAFDQLELQLPVSVESGAVVWGVSGNAGWKIRYFVDENTLIRRVVAEDGTITQMDRTIAENLDPDFAAGKGFAVSLNGTLVTLSVRLVGTRGERTWSRELTTSVSLRN